MNLRDTLVVLDTCVLLKARVSDVIMDLRAEGVFSVHWTENIDDEFLRNLQLAYEVSEAAAQRRLMAMKARCPEWEVFMTSADFSTVPKRVPRKDRHVAAAALALLHAADKDRESEPDQACDIILVTDNVKDFAKNEMFKLGVRVVRPGAFLDEVYGAEPEAATRAVLQATKDLKKPPYTVAELLYALRSQGATTLVAQMAKALGVAPVEKEARRRGKAGKQAAK